MEELIEQIKERIKILQLKPNAVNIGKVAELTLVNKRLAKINYTRCCETLKGNEIISFEEYLKKFYTKNWNNYINKKGIVTSLEEIEQRYDWYLKHL